MKTTINITIECARIETFNLAHAKLLQMIQEATDFMCTLAKKDNLKINVLSD